MSLAPRVLGFWTAAVLGACGAPSPSTAGADQAGDEQALAVDLGAFTPSAPLFADEGAPIVTCGAGGVVLEGGALEVRTGLCDPADIALPMPDVEGATHIRGTLTHDALVADGGVGHVALTVDGVTMWELEVPIPAAAGYTTIDAALPVDGAARSTLGFHVHNHGANAWRLHDLVIERR